MHGRHDLAASSNSQTFQSFFCESRHSQKKCTKCKQTLDLSQFYDHPKKKDGRQSRCKLCHNTTRTDTAPKFFNAMYHGAKHRSKAVHAKRKSGTFDVSTQDLIDLYEKQNGHGYLSGMPMIPKPHCDWQASIERRNPSITYTNDNVRLECLEFNHPRTWTLEKINQIPELISSTIDIDVLSQKCQLAKQKPKICRRKKLTLSTINRSVNNEFYCSRCYLYKHKDLFFKNRVWCKACCKEYETEKNKELRTFAQRCLTTARYRHNHPGKHMTKSEFDIDLNFFLNRITIQRGRGFYSGIPMQYEPNCDWKCSLERLDTKIGYESHNVVLEAWEFNTSNFSLRSKTPDRVQGSAQWNRSKIELFYKTKFGRNILLDMPGDEYHHWKHCGA